MTSTGSVVGVILGSGQTREESSEMATQFSAVSTDLGIALAETFDLARRYLGTGKIRTVADLRRLAALMQDPMWNGGSDERHLSCLS